LREWVARWELPVALTPKAKGLVRDDYQHYIGVLDGAGLGSLMSRTLADSDLIVGLGLDPVELIRPWHATSPVIWVGNCGPEDELAAEAHRLRGRVVEVTEHLAQAPAPARWTDWTSDAVAERRALALDEDRLTWIPRALRAALPEDAIVTTDVGSHKCLISQFLPMGEPGRFLTSNGLSAMGYGLPAAIGAKLAEPGVAVLAVVGDGGFAMAAQELETAARLGLPVITVVLVDASLSLIQLLQQARGLPRCGVDYGRVDILRVAEGYGAEVLTAAAADELRAAVERGLSADGPTVIAVPIDASGYGELL
jgi:acetolactate synthase-1/2/3 large subunit